MTTENSDLPLEKQYKSPLPRVVRSLKTSIKKLKAKNSERKNKIQSLKVNKRDLEISRDRQDTCKVVT